MNALDRLLAAGRPDDKVELILGRAGHVHVKNYFRGEGVQVHKTPFGEIRTVETPD